jgi:hypothetical protein
VVLLPLEAFLQKEVQLLLLKEALPLLLKQVSNLLKEDFLQNQHQELLGDSEIYQVLQ